MGGDRDGKMPVSLAIADDVEITPQHCIIPY